MKQERSQAVQSPLLLFIKNPSLQIQVLAEVRRALFLQVTQALASFDLKQRRQVG